MFQKIHLAVELRQSTAGTVEAGTRVRSIRSAVGFKMAPRPVLSPPSHTWSTETVGHPVLVEVRMAGLCTLSGLPVQSNAFCFKPWCPPNSWAIYRTPQVAFLKSL